MPVDEVHTIAKLYSEYWNKESTDLLTNPLNHLL